MLETEIAIVGAGLSGLHAARILHHHGIDVLVLEAQNRVGGRTLTEPLSEGAFIDHGGQWISPGQEEIIHLASQLGIELFSNWDEGKTVFWRDGQKQVFSGMLPTGYEAVEQAVRDGAKALVNIAHTLPIGQPWKAAKAKEWDEVTFYDWLKDNIDNQTAAALLARSLEGVFCRTVQQTSLLSALAIIRSGAHEITRLTSNDYLGPERRVVGGAQQFCTRMAQSLGNKVLLEAVVSHIQQNGDYVLVTTQNQVVKAKRAIITLPPMLAGRILYSPSLPANRDQLTQRTPMGWVIKVHCVYPSRFWREQGLSGKTVSDEGIHNTVDNSPPNGKPGILVGFIEGRDACHLSGLSKQKRKAFTLNSLVNYFGAKAAHPTAYYEFSWGDDPYSRGVYGGFWSQGVLSHYGSTLREPINRLHWAGAETSTRWNGKLEGAIYSGKYVAEEVLQLIS